MILSSYTTLYSYLLLQSNSLWCMINSMEVYKKCTVEGCDKTMRWGKYCSMHRARLLRRGSLGGAKPEQIKHGMHTHPLYHTWENMRARCNNANHTNYSWYGARGIKVCERWNDFSKFVADVGEKPTPKHTLDRIDNNGDYEPGNVRWATHLEQMHNQRVSYKSKTGVNGVYYDKRYKNYRVSIGSDGRKYHLGTYKKLSEAIDARRAGEKKYHQIKQGTML